MRIYVSGIIQHSIFSSGHATTTLQIANTLKQLGHDIFLLNILDNNAKWYDDVHTLADRFPVLQKSDFCGSDASLDCIGGVIKADLFIDTVGCISGEDRAKIAGRTVMFIAKPPIHNEIENNVYLHGVFRRCYEGISEIWTWDFYGQNDFIFLSLLGRCKIRPIPFVWSPEILEAYLSETKIPPWYVIADSPAGQVADWNVRIAENNNSSRSSCTLPLVIMAEFKRKNPNTVRQIFIHNGDQFSERKFFMENVYAHCKDGIEPKLVGRMRCVEWIVQPRSVLLAHCRFTPFRYLYFDAAWLGIPLIHNSPLLRKIGGPLDAYYYAENNVGQSAETIKRFIDSYKPGDHNRLGLEAVRASILRNFSVNREGVMKIWNTGLQEAASGPVRAPLATPVPLPDRFIVQFMGMWDKFQVDYNFFTLLLENYFKKCEQPVKVVGVGEEYKEELIHVRILGPFGQKQPVLGGIPAIFTTSENIPILTDDICEKNMIRVQLGFSRSAHNGKSYIRLPLWMMSIDWFGADNIRIVNPKLIPVDWLIKSQVGPAPRPKFCSFVVTNPTNQKRNDALDLMGRVGRVDSAGRYRNNCGSDIFAGLGGGGGELKKVEFFRNYRFAITYENSYGEGYVTEKLFHAKAAGCVPIYWGDNEAAEEDFVAGGWINAGAMSDEELVSRVRWLESPEGTAERERMASLPLLNEEKLGRAARRLDEVAAAIINASLFNQGIKTTIKETNRNATSYGRAY